MKDVLFTNMDSHKLKGISQGIYIIQARSAPCLSGALGLCKRSARPPAQRRSNALSDIGLMLLALPGDPRGPGCKSLSAPEDRRWQEEPEDLEEPQGHRAISWPHGQAAQDDLRHQPRGC